MDNPKIISTVTTNSFFEKWTKAEQYNSDNNRHDQNSWDRIKFFGEKNLNIFFIEILPNKILDQLLIPYHAGQNHYFKTSPVGSSLKEFIDSYSYQQVVQNIQDTCAKSIQYHIDLFTKQKGAGQLFVEGVFMYCTQNVELSPDVNNKAEKFLYAGSFHQFAAYGLFVKQFGPIPLRLYLCNNVT